MPTHPFAAASLSPASADENTVAVRADVLSRARTASGFLEFAAWLAGSSSAAGCDEDMLFQTPAAPPAAVVDDLPLNDLPGVLEAVGGGEEQLQQHGLAPLAAALLRQQPQQQQSPQAQRADAAGGSSGLGTPQNSVPAHHRAVITAMPLPGSARPAGGGGGDTTSAATLPMPHTRKRRRGEQEDDDDDACSSPNDLVEVPSQQQQQQATVTTAAAAAARADTGAGGRDQAAAAAPGRPAQAAARGAAVCASAPAVAKGILVSKVLTKSDAGSKRIILPRIAVEANLPQLSPSVTVFNFSATDPTGASWPLVIKAWANGSNPKPVYVLEQVGELLKLHHLGVGDAVALLASEDGAFWLEWNTPAAKAAAARPTYSGVTFKHLPKPAAAAAGKAGGSKQAGKQAGKRKQQQAQAQQLAQQPPAAAAAAEPQLAQQPAQQPVAQQPAPAPAPRPALQPPSLVSLASLSAFTAVPVSSQAQVPGLFTPTSPCQLLVPGPAPACLPELELLPDLAPSLPSGMLLPAGGASGAAAAAGLDGSGPSDGSDVLLPVEGVPHLSHAGGFLLCPRTEGCTRPAGHQGWCLGHKGYKKRRA